MWLYLCFGRVVPVGTCHTLRVDGIHPLSVFASAVRRKPNDLHRVHSCVSDQCKFSFTSVVSTNVILNRMCVWQEASAVCARAQLL